jgi:hypothetical protein
MSTQDRRRPAHSTDLQERESCGWLRSIMDIYGCAYVALLMRFGVTPHPGFKSRSLRCRREKLI